MSLEPAVALLQRVDLFSGLDAVRLEVVAFTCERREYAPGETLFETGEEADCAWLILEGEAVMLAAQDKGLPRALRLDTGDLIGETALFNRERRRTCVRAVTQLETLRIGRDMFQRLLGEFPEMASLLQRVWRTDWKMPGRSFGHWNYGSHKAERKKRSKGGERNE
ncbi:cyclic nucleotide-binding domain-containing protein [Parvibaculum sp.]|uniref:cyclic nucleotide-binding domain-containing protein n=1 Tax=Parvibaculum sp. TaxID=2024848 RepID=UPI000C463831|nr:cyclic nucleotide-binding domain-containing protein [Parvibaculum sp.]MAM95923.1 cyclic nucleotide-binding protein [Parvibaculum sp.]